MKKYVLCKVSQGKFHIRKRSHLGVKPYLCGVTTPGIRILSGTHAKLKKLLNSSWMCKRCRAAIEKIGAPTKLILVR